MSENDQIPTEPQDLEPEAVAPVQELPPTMPAEPYYQQAPASPNPAEPYYQQAPAAPNLAAPYYQQAPAYPNPVPGMPMGVPTYQTVLDLPNSGIIGMEGSTATMPVLQLQNLTKIYNGKIAVDSINLNIYPGRIIGLLGPNGSGKTTTIKMIAGLLKPTQGNILIMGQKPGIVSKSFVSYLPERTYLDEEMTAQNTVAYFKDFYADFDANRAMEMLGHLGIDPRMRMKSMSKGTKEKVQLILVMSRRAHLYLLDEPIGGVDPAARDYILHTILTNYSPESAVILSTHLIYDIEPALDDVIFINQSRVVLTSSVDEIREQYGKNVNDLFREVFRC